MVFKKIERLKRPVPFSVPILFAQKIRFFSLSASNSECRPVIFGGVSFYWKAFADCYTVDCTRIGIKGLVMQAFHRYTLIISLHLCGARGAEIANS